MNISRILCPIDFSDASFHALQKACETALHFAAELILVHVIAPMPSVAGMEGLEDFDLVEFRRALHERMTGLLQKEARERVPGELQTRLFVRCGHAADEIVELSKDENVDLIVVSTHGMTGWRHYVFGSVAQKIIRHSSLPVLVIHAPSDTMRKESQEAESADSEPCVRPA